METEMFNREAALLAVVVAGILITSGALSILSEGNAQAGGPLPPQIDTLDPTSNVWNLPDQTVANPN
jgi:hypothetical protein